MPRKQKPFESYTEKVGDCLIWRGARNSDGYGSYRYGGRGPSKAHHVALWRAGQLIPHGYVVMHVCDNRLCVNVNHLRVATQKENIHDAIQKGRVPHIATPGHPDVDRVMGLSGQGVSARRIAEWLGASRNTISAMLRESRNRT